MVIKKSIILDIIILLAFTVYFLARQNYEFLFYSLTIGIVIYILFKLDKIYNFSKLAMYGFAGWLFLHFSGGAFKLNGIKLYNSILIPLIGEPYNILRYDQLIHGICYFVITLFVYAVIVKIADKKTNRLTIAVMAVLAGAGIGALNEIIEFITVVFFDAGAAVGDYTNTALDIVFNFIGAIVAVVFGSKTYGTKK